ncbi:hypothetical protein J2741_001572 [Methanolinea mesophila]|uniref:hypothetical protein n=1 Tax=Methanolinea mesophila TaxID=547055 RepID=UPI001AEA2C96|nr:hypothetical protein [Methanolinea mesophila]MBP1929025.1 hypothetical protein [Methanolinea mesophila]
MVRCRECGWEYGEWQGQCPQCGAPLLKRHRPLTRFLAGVGVLVIIVAGFGIFTGSFPGTGGGGYLPASPGIVVTVAPPPCEVRNIQVLAVPRPGGNIDLIVQGGDLAITGTLEVLVDGEPVGVLEPRVGAMMTVSGAERSGTLAVIANSTCGRETLVFQKNL